MDKTIFGKIVKEKTISGKINKGIGMGELPKAEGVSEFLSPAYSVSGTSLESVQIAIMEKAGIEEKPVFPEGFVSAVEEIRNISVYNAPRGFLYMKDTMIPVSVDFSLSDSSYAGCEHLETVVFSGVDFVLSKSNRNIFSNCPVLRKADLATWTKGCAALTFTSTPALEEVVFGEVGRPVTELQAYWMRDCNASGVEVTVYVDATTLADIPAAVTSNANGGRYDAVIIYRNATTGEVIEV